MNKKQNIEHLFNSATFVGVLLFIEYSTTFVYESENGKVIMKEWVDCDDEDNDIFFLYIVSKDDLNDFIVNNIDHKDLYYRAENNYGILIYESSKDSEIVEISNLPSDYIPNESCMFSIEECNDFEKIVEFLGYNEQSAKNFEPSESKVKLAKNAMKLELFEVAEKLVCSILIDPPSSEIAEEMRDLLDKLNFNRHLNAQGLIFDDNEIEISLAGNGVSAGLVNIIELDERLVSVSNIIGRTAERMIGKDFRQQGNIDAKVKKLYSPYVSMPRSASYAVTLKFVQDSEVRVDQEQIIDGNPFISKVIDEALENINLYNNGEEQRLRQKLNDESYYQNFNAFAKKLLPDGNEINLVGITSYRGEESKKYRITRIRKKIDKSEKIESLITQEETKSTIVITGILNFASDNSHKIKIFNESDKKSYEIIVPDGMNDVVTSYWAKEVTLKVFHKKNTKKTFILEEIE